MKEKTRITTAGVAKKGNLFLIAKRQKGGPLSEMWEFPGGKNRYGETICETLEREWQEELGVKIIVGDFLLETEFYNTGIHYYLKCHEIKLLDENFTLCVHQEIKWATKEEMEELVFGPSDSVIKNWIIKNK